MNILFYISCTPNPLNGGIERVSNILAEEFIKHGHNCYCIYYMEVEKGYQSPFFKSQDFIPLDSDTIKEDIEYVIMENNIDVVLNQLAYIPQICSVFNNLKGKYNYKLFTVHHNNPFLSNARLKSEGVNSLKSLIKKCISLLYPMLLINRFRQKYLNELRNHLQFCDYYVCLSKSYVSNIRQYNISSSKLISIYNPLTYPDWYNIDYYNLKEKIVLFVGRYSEDQKRISKSLKIWKSLEKYGYNGWRFVLIGHGPDEHKYRKLIKDLKICNVELKGKGNPFEYYQKASIFLMTSSYEGWPMTIAEAKQNGVVPICFDTFSACREIINNNLDGYIIKESRNSEFRDKLFLLMNDDSLRKKMAGNGIEYSKNFTAEKIANQWLSLIEK